MRSLINLHDELKYFLDNHLGGIRFEFEYEEQLPNLSTEGKDFPFVFATPISFNYSDNLNYHTIRIWVYNRIDRDRSNILDSTNDTSLILTDIAKWWNNDNQNSLMELTNQPNATSINNSQMDYLQGYVADFTFSIPNYNRCEVPMPGGVPAVREGEYILQRYLTCESLGTCSTFTQSIGNLQDQIDNLDAEKWTQSVILDDTELDFTRNDGSTYSVDLQPLITDIENDITTISGSVSQNRLDIDSNDNDISILQGSYSSLDTRVTTNENDITDIENDITTISGSVSQNRLDIDSNDNDISTLETYQSEGLSTGIIQGGKLSINSIDNTTFDISAGKGYVVDYTTYPQTTTLVEWTAQTGITVNNLTTSFATDIAIDINGNIVQQNSYSRTELRSVIFLGGLDHSNQTNIRNVFDINVPTYGVGSTLKDLALTLGPLNIEGNVFSPNGDNLKLDKSSGQVFSLGRNYQNQPNDPNVENVVATTQQPFNYVFDDGTGTGSFGPEVTDIDPDSYDDGTGTLGTVSNNDYTIQRILMFPNTGNVFIQYGENIYNQLSDALNSISTQNFKDLNGIRTALTRGYLIVKQGTTDLQDTNDAQFVGANKFGDVGSLGGSSANFYTEAATLSGNIIDFDRNDITSAYSVDLSPALGNYLPLTGGTLTGSLDVQGEVTVDVERWTIDLMDATTVTVYADEAISITAINNIVNTPTTTITVNGAAYTLGNPIASGDKIDITVSILSVIKLKIEK